MEELADIALNIQLRSQNLLTWPKRFNTLEHSILETM